MYGRCDNVTLPIHHKKVGIILKIENHIVNVCLKLVYICICLSASVFYINAFFWKNTTVLCGKIWLFLCVTFCIANVLNRYHKTKFYRFLSIFCISVITCIQFVAAWFWVILSDGRHIFTIFSHQCLISPIGAIIHIFILFIGITLLRNESN